MDPSWQVANHLFPKGYTCSGDLPAVEILKGVTDGGDGENGGSDCTRGGFLGGTSTCVKSSGFVESRLDAAFTMGD